MSPTMTNRFGAANTPAKTPHQPGCCCPACINLECMERPRYFAGQLLTEADLNSEQAYMLAKNRLHNRYLHGVGVVCGLEVTCGECDGWVSIAPGYAIDPCGNDVIVCSRQDFNLIQAIQDCCTSQRPKKPDCRPFDPAPPKGCTGLEEEWCITIRYREKEARPTANLPRQKPSSCGCACGCGTKKKGCGCNCHSSSNGGGYGAKASNGCSSASVTATQNCQNPPIGVCEPTRIVETYQLGVCFKDCSKTFQEALQDTLLLRILECLTGMWSFIGARVAPNQRTVLFETAFMKQTSAVPGALFEAHTRFHRAVIDLYTQNPFNVRCSAFNTLQNIQTPVPGVGEESSAYFNRVQPWTVSLFGLVVQYAIDCVCHALLPPCPGDPCDDRLTLACATVKDGKILRICNFSCRQFAGAFPSFFYWLSAVPIVAILKWMVERLCCRTDLVRSQSPLVDDFAALMNTIDPSGKLRAAVVQEDFAALHRYTSAAAGTWQQLAARVVSFAFNPGDVNLASFAGKTASDTIASLRRLGIGASTVDVKSAEDVPAFATLTSSPFASKGDSVVLYTSGGKVVSANRASTRPNTPPPAPPPTAAPAGGRDAVGPPAPPTPAPTVARPPQAGRKERQDRKALEEVEEREEKRDGKARPKTDLKTKKKKP